MIYFKLVTNSVMDLMYQHSDRIRFVNIREKIFFTLSCLSLRVSFTA